MFKIFFIKEHDKVYFRYTNDEARAFETKKLYGAIAVKYWYSRKSAVTRRFIDPPPVVYVYSSERGYALQFKEW
jgi:hypothetical protein